MKRNIRIALALCLATAPVIGLAGCGNDVLSTAPTDQLSDASFWKQPGDAIMAVNGIYQLLSGWDYLFMDAATDNAWAQKTFDGWYNIGMGTMDASSGTSNGIWVNSYRAIRRANEVLANIDKIPKMDSTLKMRLEGEARFHRAYQYNMLANLFGDVPLVLTPIDIAQGVSAKRTPKDQVIDQVLADCDFAASVLPLKYGAADAGRATKGAALALEARAALWAGRWQVAADAAQAVMNLGVYGLYPNYGDLFRYAGANNPNDNEIIYADQRLANFRPQSAFSTFGPRSMQGGSEVVPLQSLVDAYLMKDGLPTSQSPLYDPANPYANRDPRMYATLLYPGATFGGQVFNSIPGNTQDPMDQAGNDFNATSTGYQYIKYVDPLDRANPSNSGINLIVMRYAEVLLTYVEAKVELGQVDQSVIDAFNQVRTRAGMPTVTTVTLDMVRLERRVEFAGEGLRLFDIRRWKIADSVMNGPTYGMTYTDASGNAVTIPGPVRKFTDPRDYLWPIPLAEINLNPGLGQNPGY